MAFVHRIGDPENDSEAKAIRELARLLPENYHVIHNFELAGDTGLPYEYDIAVLGEHAVYHVEVKGYRGLIRGDRHQWTFENGAVYPSPIPLANKKTKVLASRLRRSKLLESVFVETVVLLTDERARAQLRDEQAGRVIHLRDAERLLTAPGPRAILALHDPICEAILGSRPSKKVRQIGLYNVLEKINQTESRAVYLAEHRYIRVRPKTILKVFHVDLYASKEERERRIQAIFHDQEALRTISGHPNIVQTGDFFAWEGDKFVLPTEYMERGRPLEVLLDKEEDRALTWEEKRRIVAQAAQGLAHAHRGGVIHRDIRPLSLVVAPGQLVKIVNFDLAKIRDGVDPPDVARRLDPRYAAPEVRRDPASATPRSDVYSLGRVFYELIVGEIADPLDKARLARGLAPSGGDDAAATILRMCSPDPAARQASMEEVIEDLQLV
jgi:hypothetical protein